MATVVSVVYVPRLPLASVQVVVGIAYLEVRNVVLDQLIHAVVVIVSFLQVKPMAHV